MKRKYRIIGVIFCLLLALDQASKLVIERSLPLHHAREVIPGFFHITHVRNSGAAFGLLAHIPGAAIVFVFVSLIAIALILAYIRQIKEGEVWTPVCLALILSGAVGNVIDRFRLGVVVDFLDLHYRGWHWPAFNVADACITMGVIALVLKVLSGKGTAAQGGA
jgi:signal peptidase II